jgi:hypothetical protein
MRRLLTCAVVAAALAASAAPAAASQDRDHERQRSRSDERRGERTQPAPPANRAVPRTTPPPVYAREDRRENERRDEERRDDNRRGYNSRNYDRRDYDGHRYDRRGYDRGGRVIIVPRIVRPSIIGVIPYRPYFYRPSYRAYYGYYDPYAYPAAPYGYYSPVPGRPYGGVRITGVPRDAQVFADGYYVGIVDDFDGIFQHLNLEAGPHHIEIVEPGLQPIAFDVMVRPGETITYRAQMYGAYRY